MKLSFHGHDDMGMSTANSLAALMAGADRFHGTVNGLGERCGNCAIEDVALALKYRYGIDTMDLTKIQALSKLVAGLSNVYPAKGKAVVGEYAMMHDASIHHAGLERNMTMYEPYPPAMVGKKHALSLGKLSGPKTIFGKLKQFGEALEEERIPELLRLVQQMNESGAIVSDADFLLLLDKVKGNGSHEKVAIEEINILSGNKNTPTAAVQLRFNGDKELHFGASTGDGPVDAAINAVNDALGDNRARLVAYNVEAISGGSDAAIRLNVTVELNGRTLNSSAMGTDILMTSVNAYLKAVNVLM
jgi:D-citramalate synthase